MEPDYVLNLADPGVHRRYVAHPELLLETLAAAPVLTRPVFIDEVQKVPALLDALQVVLDATPKRFRFLLSGLQAQARASQTATGAGGGLFHAPVARARTRSERSTSNARWRRHVARDVDRGRTPLDERSYFGATPTCTCAKKCRPRRSHVIWVVTRGCSTACLPRRASEASTCSRSGSFWLSFRRDSNPCIAYLMEGDTMPMLALLIAHACSGHPVLVAEGDPRYARLRRHRTPRGCVRSTVKIRLSEPNFHGSGFLSATFHAPDWQRPLDQARCVELSTRSPRLGCSRIMPPWKRTS